MSVFKHAQTVRIQIILRMHKVSSKYSMILLADS